MSNAARFSPQVPQASTWKIRLLFGCTGWPSGILDVGSWAAHSGLAEVCVFQMQPGYVCTLADEDRSNLIAGPLDDDLRDALRRHGLCLGTDVQVRPLADAWELDDRSAGAVYHLREAAGRLEVRRPAECDLERLRAVIDQHVSPQIARDGWFDPDGRPTPGALAALQALGLAMIEKLLAFAPHVVGFRLEGGGFAEVCKIVAAVRLFSGAEIVLGGPTATSHPGEVLDGCGADYVFAGEAEESFADFLRLGWEPNSRDRAPEIPGLTYRYGGRTYHNTLPADGYGRTLVETDPELRGPEQTYLRHYVRPQIVQDVLAANQLDWSLLENFRREFESLYFVGGRGCPGQCAFCARQHGQEVRVKSATQLLDEIAAADACLRAGKLRVGRWPLFRYVEGSNLCERQVAWAAIYDEDFFLNRRRAIEFFVLWERSLLWERYRLSVQTNPCSLLAADGRFHPELWQWIDRLKPMIQLGAESFHDGLLERWQKRHQRRQLLTVLEGLERTRQDYTVFQILTDLESTAAEFLEALGLLVQAALAHPHMRIASGPYVIPLYDSDSRRRWEYGVRRPTAQACHFTDYERPQPEWMDPLAAELAELADAELQFTLTPEHRNAALVQAVEAVYQRVETHWQRVCADPAVSLHARQRIEELRQLARAVRDDAREACFRSV